MATTYDPSKIKDGGRDEVRFLVGDTGPGFGEEDWLISDEEIDAIIAVVTITLLAAAEVADSISARFSRKVNVTNSRIKLENQAKAKAYMELARKLRGRAGVDQSESGLIVPDAEMYVGGISKAEQANDAADSDFIQPQFGVGQDDHPGVHPDSLRRQEDDFC